MKPRHAFASFMLASTAMLGHVDARAQKVSPTVESMPNFLGNRFNAKDSTMTLMFDAQPTVNMHHAYMLAVNVKDTNKNGAFGDAADARTAVTYTTKPHSDEKVSLDLVSGEFRIVSPHAPLSHDDADMTTSVERAFNDQRHAFACKVGTLFEARKQVAQIYNFGF